MEDEEKKEGGSVITLGGGSTTTVNPKKSVTKHGESRTYKTEYTLDPDEKSQQAYRESIRVPLANMYDVDPETGRYKGSVGAILGFDPEKYKEQQEREAAAERNKLWQKDIANALSIITKTATRAAGGAVRVDKPMSVKEHADKEKAAKDNIAKLPDLIERAKRGREQEYLKAEQEAVDKWIKKHQQKVTDSRTTRGDDVTTTTGGGSRTTSYRQQYVGPSGGGSGSGSGAPAGMVEVAQKKTDGTRHTFYVPKEKAFSYARHWITSVSQEVNRLEKKKKREGHLTDAEQKSYDRLISATKEAGIVDIHKFDANKDNIGDDEIRLVLANGRTFNLNGLDTELADMREESTGAKTHYNELGKEDTGWNPDVEKKKANQKANEESLEQTIF